MLFAFMHSNFLRLVRINVLAWGEERGELGYCQISVPVPLTHTLSPPCSPCRRSWSMTHLCIIIRNSWEKEMYQFKGNPCLPKWKNLWAKYNKKSLPALLLPYPVQLLHFQLQQSFSLSIIISVGKLLPNRCAGGRGEGCCAGVSGRVLDSGCECVH